jgi:hypothetical protein
VFHSLPQQRCRCRSHFQIPKPRSWNLELVFNEARVGGSGNFGDFPSFSCLMSSALVTGGLEEMKENFRISENEGDKLLV